MPGRCAVKADGLLPFDVPGVTGCSSRMSSTRFPAANVFCRVLPSAASATTGQRRKTARWWESTHRIADLPWPDTGLCRPGALARSKARIAAPVTALFRRRCASSALPSARVHPCARSSAQGVWRPWPYCCVSLRPRRLSSTNALSSPDLVRKTSPLSPLAGYRSGITTPTTA